MELDKIEKLLASYFEGTTTLAEEKTLKNYFNTKVIDEAFIPYKDFFAALHLATEEQSNKDVLVLENKEKPSRTKWYSIAALLVIALGAGIFYYSQPNYSQEEKEALAAFEKSKNALMLLSENLNKGTEQLTFVKQFTVTKDKIFE